MPLVIKIKSLEGEDVEKILLNARKTIDGNSQESFVIAMGRQTETGVQSGRMASISLLNNTSGDYLVFKQRPSGNYSPLYYPATTPGADAGQLETSGFGKC